ncbi:unnamed protein product [Discula destructiva]
MGRPRKRPRSTSNPAHVTAAPASTGQDDLVESLPAVSKDVDLGLINDATLDLDPSSLIDPSLVYGTDTPISDMTFLDFLATDFTPVQAPNMTRSRSGLAIDPTTWTTPQYDINLDPNSTSLKPPSLTSQGTSPSEHTSDSLPPPISPSLDDASQPSTCSCLAKLYLALDSLTRLPTSVLPALHTARTAARTAHATLRCTVCCPPLQHSLATTATPAPGAAPFQNMMLLGALIPSIVDAYHKILALVDVETARAISAQTQLTFSLSAYGGCWGDANGESSGSGNSGACSGADAVYESKVMEPAVWRLSVRGLLKMDVYGASGGSRRLPWQVTGLRDLVAEMDEKSRTRHAEIDALLDAGLTVPSMMRGLPAHHTVGKEPHCRPIIQVAIEAVASLHIA